MTASGPGIGIWVVKYDGWASGRRMVGGGGCAYIMMIINEGMRSGGHLGEEGPMGSNAFKVLVAFTPCHRPPRIQSYTYTMAISEG